MLGMKNGGQNMPQGQNPNLAGLFRNNMPAGPTAPPTQLPQIMAPQRPMAMPPAQTRPMMQGGPAQPTWTPNSMVATGDGRLKPAWMTSLIQQTGRPTAPQTNKSAYTTFRNR